MNTRVSARSSRLMAGAAAAALMAGTATFAAAQTPAPSGAGAAGGTRLDEVIVTGTSIRGVAPAGSPVIGLSQDDIRNTPATTTTELMRQLPQVFNLGTTDTQFTSSNGSNGNITLASAVNLRGLGTEATLTLLDGRRMTSQGPGATFFDPSAIPTVAIGRIEVLSDGGSAIYGSDAVGGVINIMLRQNFNGAELAATYGHADGTSQKVVSGVVGKTWESGGFMVAAEINTRDRLATADRWKYYSADLRPYGGADLRVFNSVPGNIQAGTVRYALPAGPGTGINPAQLVPNTANRISPYLGGDALPEQERRNLTASFHQDLSDRVRFSAQGLYSARDGDRTVGPTFNPVLVVPRSNPFFVNPANPAAQSVTLNYSYLNDFGPSHRIAESTLSYGTAQFEVDLFSDWVATPYVTYSRATDRSRLTAGANTAALTAALADPNPATAFNPFGSGGLTNPTTLAKISATTLSTDSSNSLSEYGVSASGSFIQLPGGPLKGAFGVGRQEGENTQNTLQNVGTPSNLVFAGTPTRSERTVDFAFGEVFIPIFGPDNAAPGLQELSASIAVRYDKYSDFGGATNPKVGLVWAPISDLKLRASYGKSFRAPSLLDVTQGLALTIVVQDFADPASQTGLSRTLWVRGNRPNMEPERAETYSVGFDFAPHWLDGLSVSGTYYSVQYTDRLDAPGNDTTALSKPGILSQFIIRNPPPSLTIPYLTDPNYTGTERNPANIQVLLDGQKTNTGRIETDGVDFDARYRFANGLGDWNVGLSGSYVLHFKRQLTETAPLIDFVDIINNPQQLRLRGQVGWRRDGLGVTAYVNHVGDYTNNLVTPAAKVGSYTTFDVSARYAVPEGLLGLGGVSLSLDVQNVTDKEPPIVLNGDQAFDPQVAGILGRYITVGIRKTF